MRTMIGRSSSIGVPASGRRGFSLVELLVVLGLLAALLAFLFPVIRRAREKSQALACKSQLHALGAAVQLYLNASKGHYPLCPQLPSVNPSGLPTLTSELLPHTANQIKVFRCPSDEAVFPKEGISYFYYSELGLTPLAQTFFYKVFKSASAVPVLWDADHFHGGTLPYNWLFADGHVDELYNAVH